MSLQSVRGQLNDAYTRLIRTNISVRQFYPREQSLPDGGCAIGNISLSSVSLRDLPYSDIYADLDGNNTYHVKLADGGLLIFQYVFDASGAVSRHRLCYFPSHELPSMEDSPHLYEHDELYGDVVERRLVRFPIRFDFSPNDHREVDHPKSHMTLGQYENCRIPVAGPVSPNSFLLFILRNFYSRFYHKNKNEFDRRFMHFPFIETITGAEQRVMHLVNGR